MRSTKSVFGVEWPVPDTGDIAFIFIFFVVIALLFGAVFYLLRLNRKKKEEHDAFLFRIKNLGLNKQQLSFLLTMKNIFSIKDYETVNNNLQLFESFIPQYIQTFHVKKGDAGLPKVPLSVCRDITVLLEKIYHAKKYQAPLDVLMDIEEGTAICINEGSNRALAGKLVKIEENALTILPLHESDLSGGAAADSVTVFFWRSGDSDYTFQTTMKKLKDGSISLPIPESFNRGKEVRRPYIDALIPCRVAVAFRSADSDQSEFEPGTENEAIPGQIIKMNEMEAVVRMDRQPKAKSLYALEFELTEFKVRASVKILSSQSIQGIANEASRYYCTFKYENLSAPAHQVIKNFVTAKMQNF